MSKLKNPIVVPLDVDDPQKAMQLVSLLKGKVGGFKIGPRLTFKSKPLFFELLKESGVFFFDHKFFDIPSTTVAAVRSAFDLGATWVTVHALNGADCLKELAKLEAELKKSRPEFRILVVTVLTSFSEENLPPVWSEHLDIAESVRVLARSASSVGLHSFVSSAFELEILKSEHRDGFFVVPGIRPVGSAHQDQSRVATPKSAIDMGASALIIGRPIIEAADPLKVVEEVLKQL